ncbi:MAG: GYD domain-containing protein [Pseudonocardia sp.]
MAKFLWHGSYSQRGVKALVEEGGTARRAGVERAVTAMGGTLETMYFAFGDDDYYAVVDLPDNVSAAAVGLATALAGAVQLRTVVLLTAADLDEAARRAHEYQGPGAR